VIAVVDYHMGNLRSVERGLCAVGGDARITDVPAEIEAADAVVLPGVGAFADASEVLLQTGQMAAIRKAVDAGKPFLGICLGLHLMFEGGVEGASAEAPAEGLRFIPGVAVKLPSVDAAGNQYKIPHVGWNSLAYRECMTKGTVPNVISSCHSERSEESPTSKLFDGIEQGEFFYFTHSYMAPDSAYTSATTTHSVEFPSAVDIDGRIFGVQFHPEKSSDIGMKMLSNFVNIVATFKEA